MAPIRDRDLESHSKGLFGHCLADDENKVVNVG
jgi:hypothetical protein